MCIAYVCDVARQRRERSQGRRWLKTAGESRRFAGSGSPRAAGGRRDPMQQGKAPRRFGTRPTGRPWRGVAWRDPAPPARGAGSCPPLPGRPAGFAGPGRRGRGRAAPLPPRLPRVTAPHTPLPPRTAQKGSFPLLSPTQCLFPWLKKKKKTYNQKPASVPLKPTPAARGGGRSPRSSGRGDKERRGRGGEWRVFELPVKVNR